MKKYIMQSDLGDYILGLYEQAVEDGKEITIHIDCGKQEIVASNIHGESISVQVIENTASYHEDYETLTELS